MKKLTLDFETYFDRQYSLRMLSIPEYVHDRRFHVQGVAVGWPDGKTEFRADVDCCLAEIRRLYGDHLESITVVCHNAMFDLYILNHLYGIRPRFFLDTMLLAYHAHGRPSKGGGESASLHALAEKYRLAPKGDLAFMEGVRHPSPSQLADLSDYARRDVEITAKLADILLPKLTRSDTELWIMMHTVRLFTERPVLVDVLAIDALKRECEEGVAKLLEDVGATAEQISGNKSFTELIGEALARTSRSVPMKEGKKGLIPAMAKDDPEWQALIDDDDPGVATLVRARLGKKSADQQLARLLTLQGIAVATGGYLPPHLVYYGGHTGRFAGGGGFNIQNMGRTGPGLQIRQLLIARPKHMFVIADFAQIEARVTAWLAGEHDMLQSFARGEDLYSQFAATTFNTEVRKPMASDPKDVRAHLGRLRQVGKQAVLGLGYCMGAKKFMETLQADSQIKGMFETGDLNAAGCHEIVETYRHTYTRIRQLWKDLDAAIRNAVDGGNDSVGPLIIRREQNDMTITLPNRRALRYANVRWDHALHKIEYLDDEGVERELVTDKPQVAYGIDSRLYGGKATENAVQAIARDVLVDAMLEMESQGLRVLFHVHDEVVVEVAEQDAEKAKADVEKIMNTTPDWAPGLPLACEVRIAERFGK